MSFESDCYSLI